MTARLKRIRLFGEGVFAKSPVVTRQRRLNVYLEIRKDEDRSNVVAYGTPGLKLAFSVGSGPQVPTRGLIGNDTALYAVSGNLVSSLSAIGNTLTSGVIGTSSGLVGMALNPTQLLVVDGSAGYVFNPTTGLVTTIGASFPNGAKTAAYCNGFFICELPGTNQFFVSNLNDGTTWSGLSFAAAVQAIDGIEAIDSIGGLLIIFSAGHTEFWQNVGANPEPFIYIQNSATMYGIEAIYSRVHCGDKLYFLAHTGGGSFQNSSGSFQICKIQGYQVSVASTTDIDNILQTMARTSTIQDCTAYSYMADEHHFAQFNFPTANRSLLLDTTTGFWSEVQSGVTQGYAARHLGNLAASAYDQTFVSDFSNGNIYTYDPTVYTDNGNTIVREIVSRAAVEDFNTFRISQIYLDMETGVGLSQPTQQGYNPMVELSIARDGRDFGVSRLIQLGQRGQYSTRVNSRRWGKARVANLRIRYTDPTQFVLTGGAIMTSSRATPQGRRSRGRAA